jgi:hypothetical protein
MGMIKILSGWRFSQTKSTPIKCGGAPQNHVFGLRLLA